METQDILKKVRRIEIKTKRLSDHIFSGEYHSSFKGRGMTFSEVRPYQYGDDIRTIDWNVTARFKEPYIKVFEEERELTMMLLVDVSGSESFGTSVQQKREMITEMCATLAFSAIQNNDKVGVIFFTDEIEMFIPPKKGKSHILRIIRELVDFQPKSTGTDLNKALKYFANIMKKKTIAFILSDFMNDGYEEPLKIAAKKHDITGIRVYDRNEESIPNLGMVNMTDAETGKTMLVNTASNSVRSQYANWYQNNKKYFKNAFLKSGSGTIDTRVDRSYVKALLGYFKNREK